MLKYKVEMVKKVNIDMKIKERKEEVQKTQVPHLVKRLLRWNRKPLLT